MAVVLVLAAVPATAINEICPVEGVDLCVDLHEYGDPQGLVTGWAPVRLDVAVAADADLVAHHGPAWQDVVDEVTAKVDAFYRDEVQIRVEVTDVHPHDGVFTSDDPEVLLDQLEDHYRSDHEDVPRDVTHLYTGKDMGGTVGIAKQGSAGNPNASWSLSRAAGSNGTEVGDTGLVAFADLHAKIAAHEIGHTLDARHEHAECASSLARYDPGRPTDACTLMMPEVSFTSMRFSPVNQLLVRGHVGR